MEKSKRRSREEWEGIVSEQERSDQNARLFCEERSIGLASFYQWRRRRRHGEVETGASLSRGAFIDVGAIPQKESVPSWEVALELGDGMMLTLRRG